MKAPSILRTFLLFTCCAIASFSAEKKAGKGKTAPTPTDITIEKDIAYGTDEKQKLDLYLPKTITGKLPAVICLHGGGGDKVSYSAAATRLARSGYVAITPNYREEPAPAYPKCLDDVKATLAWLNKRDEVDTKRIGAMGGSAGGWLSSMLGTQEFDQKVKCVINQFGPTDLNDPELEGINPAFWSSPERGLAKMLGADKTQDKKLRAEASPVTYISADDAEFIFTRSINDRLVVKSQALRMIEKLRAIGKTVPDLYEIQGEGNGHALQMSKEEAERIWKIQQDFLDKHLKNN